MIIKKKKYIVHHTQLFSFLSLSTTLMVNLVSIFCVFLLGQINFIHINPKIEYAKLCYYFHRNVEFLNIY